MEQKKKKKSAVKEVVSWLVYLIIFAAVAFFLIHYVGERTVVSGDSMLPTLQNGDNLIVDKLSYRFRDPKRFEIVVFPFRYQEDTYYMMGIFTSTVNNSKRTTEGKRSGIRAWLPRL